MRVLFLSQIVPYPPHGGVLQRGYNLIRELGRHAKVHLMAFVHPDTLPTASARQDSIARLREFCEEVEYFPLWAKTSSLHKAAALAASACSSRPFSTIAHRSPSFRDRVATAMASGRIDLVHVDTVALHPFIDGRNGLPAVLTHHNIESSLMQRRAAVEKGALARLFLHREAGKLARYEQATAPSYEMNVLVSPLDEQALRTAIPGVRTAVVPNGVDVHYFAPVAETEEPALIYTGGMNMFANRDAVLHFLGETWNLIKSSVPGVRFYAVGQDPPQEIKAIAATDPQVIVTGYVDDIRPYVRRAAVYVVPLRVGGGTRLKVLDAMAMGKAMVSTTIGCEGLEVRPGKHLLVADAPAAFAQATIALLNDRPQREALGRSARALVEERYSWPVVGRQLVDVYDQALAAKRRSR